MNISSFNIIFNLNFIYKRKEKLLDKLINIFYYCVYNRYIISNNNFNIINILSILFYQYYL